MLTYRPPAATERVLAIDPGPEKSGAVILEIDASDYLTIGADHATIPTVNQAWDQVPNADLLAIIAKEATFDGVLGLSRVIIEQIEHMGTAVGAPVFQSVRWAGRFEQAAVHLTVPVDLRSFALTRLAIVGSRRAKEAEVRARLLALYGLTSDAQAKGTKLSPGPFRGVTGHAWSAVALAVGRYIEIADRIRVKHRARAMESLQQPATASEIVTPHVERGEAWPPTMTHQPLAPVAQDDDSDAERDGF